MCPALAQSPSHDTGLAKPWGVPTTSEGRLVLAVVFNPC